MRTQRALAEYLRARRDVTQPEDLGIHRDADRRVAGLRREEVARAARISPEYYLRLEQGRAGRPSDEVLRCLAEVFGLDEVAYGYLIGLATGAVFARRDPDPSVVQDHVDRVIAMSRSTAAYVSDRHRDIIAATPLAASLGYGGLAQGRNVVTDMFGGHMRHTVAEWESMTASALATLRHDAHPHSERLAEIVDELSVDPDFVRLWRRFDVSGPQGARVEMRIPGVGVLELDVQNLSVRGLPGFQLTTLSAVPGSLADRIFTQFSSAVSESAASTSSTAMTRL